MKRLFVTILLVAFHCVGRVLALIDLTLSHAIVNKDVPLEKTKLSTRGSITLLATGSARYNPSSQSWPKSGSASEDLVYRLELTYNKKKLYAHAPYTSCKSAGKLETITLHVNDEGAIIHMDYSAAGACTSPDNVIKIELKSSDLAVSPKLEYKRLVAGPSGVPEPELEPQSFLQRYWIYIAIFLGVMLMGGGQDEGKAK